MIVRATRSHEEAYINGGYLRGTLVSSLAHVWAVIVMYAAESAFVFRPDAVHGMLSSTLGSRRRCDARFEGPPWHVVAGIRLVLALYMRRHLPAAVR